MIHRRGNGHILKPAFLGTDVEIWSMSASHCYLIRSQSLSQVCLNCTTSAYVFCNSLFRCIWIWTKRKVLVLYLESKMCTGPNKSFIRDYETGEPRVTPSRHKVLSFSIHNTFETEFMIFWDLLFQPLHVREHYVLPSALSITHNAEIFSQRSALSWTNYVFGQPVTVLKINWVSTYEFELSQRRNLQLF